jgi:hypothetical protein
MKSRELKQVGQVAIDSGRIAIADAVHVDDMDLPEGCVYKQETSQGDGLFPVFTFTELGHEYLAVRITTFTAAEFKELFMRRNPTPRIAPSDEEIWLGPVN